MTGYEGTSVRGAMGLSALLALPTVAALEFADWGRPAPATKESGSNDEPMPFENQREYRFCKAVAEHPMRRSSAYPKLARISSKTAVRVRQRLVELGYIREHTVDPPGRGRSTILLEVLQEGIDAIAQYESQAKSE